MTILKGLLAAAALLYLLVLAAMFFGQRHLQYFPGHSLKTPQDLGLPTVSVIDLTAPDGITSGLWYAPPSPGQPTILYFHGNAGSVADRADRMRAYLSQGYGVAFLSYRGFGPSHATISETGIMQDANVAYDWLIAQGEKTLPQIIIVGESLGTGVAVQLAAARPVLAVSLGAPFTSTADVAAALYPWLPVRLLMHDQFRSDLHIGQITAPLLIQHGDDDTVVPYRFGQRLFAMAGANAKFVTLRGRGHEALYEPDTWAREMAFFAKAFKG